MVKNAGYDHVKLSGKTAVITGGARGIGKASALALAKEGADIAFADLLESEAAETVSEIEALGRRAVFTRADVGKRADCERLFADAIGTLGRVDILLNNAAASVRKLLIDMEVSDVEKTWGPTLWSVFHCSQLAARQMIAQGDGGSIISISSVQGVRPYALSTAYNGAKAAVIHMSRTWAVELAQHGIRVNTIEPGWIDTPGERKHADEDEIRTLGAKLPFKRLGKPEEIAGLVVFLASDEDAGYVTGSSLRMDGGFILPRMTKLEY